MKKAVLTALVTVVATTALAAPSLFLRLIMNDKLSIKSAKVGHRNHLRQKRVLKTGPLMMKKSHSNG